MVKISLSKIDPHNQKLSKFCTLFAICHAMEIYNTGELGKQVRINPYQLVIRASYALWGRVFNRGLSIEESFEALKGKRITGTCDKKPHEFTLKYLGKMTFYVETIKRKLNNGYPVIAIINRSHAICIVGYNGEIFEVIDSQGGGYKLLSYKAFENTKYCYVIY